VLKFIRVLHVGYKNCCVIEYITAKSMFIFLKISGILNLNIPFFYAAYFSLVYMLLFNMCNSYLLYNT